MVLLDKQVIARLPQDLETIRMWKAMGLTIYIRRPTFRHNQWFKLADTSVQGKDGAKFHEADISNNEWDQWEFTLNPKS